MAVFIWLAVDVNQSWLKKVRFGMKVSELVKGKRYDHPKFYWLLYTGEHYHSFPGEWYVFRDGGRRIAFEGHDVKFMKEVG